MTIRLEAAPGEWVQQHTPLFGSWDAEPSDEIAQRLHRHVTVGTERVLHQDPGFGIQQLVDIAVKALSPGINDPTTAINAIHRITEILVAAGRDGLVPQERTDAEGTVRIVMPRAGFADLLEVSFEEIIHFGAGVPTVARAVADALDDLTRTVDAEHRSVLDEVRASVSGRRCGAPRTPRSTRQTHSGTIPSVLHEHDGAGG